jgi:hypothetical protein
MREAILEKNPPIGAATSNRIESNRIESNPNQIVIMYKITGGC